MKSLIDTSKPAELNRDSITQLVTRFYDDVRADCVLGPTFEAVLGGRWASHLPRMVEFWSTVTLGSRSFTGNVFARHMAVPGVTTLHFERWMRLWTLHTQSLFDHATARQLQEVASGIARNLYRGYFGHPAGFDVIASETHRDRR
jgi:hemoglobin